MRVQALERRRLGSSENSGVRRADRPKHVSHVWSYDFVLDQTDDGRTLKWLPRVDEFTRECLTLEVERHMTGSVANTGAADGRAGSRDSSPDYLCDLSSRFNQDCKNHTLRLSSQA